MTDQSDFKRYNIYENEELIAKTMDNLKYIDPEHATREDAISLLEFMQTTAKVVADTLPDNFDQYYKAYKAQRPG
jgi:hypothetical protein